MSPTAMAINYALAAWVVGHPSSPGKVAVGDDMCYIMLHPSKLATGRPASHVFFQFFKLKGVFFLKACPRC